ncbi:MAG: DUF2975 domain-containing protein [Novosphingobium sp.]
MAIHKSHSFATAFSWLLVFMAAISAFAAFASLIGVATAARYAFDPRHWALFPERLIVLLVATAAYALIAAFLLFLRKIVIASWRDPFTEANARRLTWMGWIAAAWQVCELVLAFAGQDVNLVSIPGLRLRLSEAETVSIGGLLTVLTLFTLAHIFARGAEMREELEGTV